MASEAGGELTGLGDAGQEGHAAAEPELGGGHPDRTSPSPGESRTPGSVLIDGFLAQTGLTLESEPPYVTDPGLSKSLSK